MSSSDPFGLAGQVLDGQFRVEALIGEGGFGAVYRGMHLGLGEPIAIKCLKVQAALGPAVVTSLMARFREESRLLYRLSQGNLDIVRSIASGSAVSPATGVMVPYMVLEWLEGRSLANELIVRRTQGATGRPLHEAIRELDSAVDALAYAHSLGVVHRDLNPGNLFIAQTPTGPRMKVLDFGLAKVLREEVLALGPRVQTLQSIRIFSPAYAAPEQFDDRIAAVSAATDVWSLAIIVMEVISDRPVFEGEALGEFFEKVLDPAYPRTPRGRGVTVGDATEKVFARALAMNPADRQKDAGVFWAELRGALSRDVGGATVKEVSHVVVPAPLPANPMTTTVRIDDSFSFEPTQASGALSPSTKPMFDVKSTMRMASAPPSPPTAAERPPPAPPPPADLFQAAAVQPALPPPRYVPPEPEETQGAMVRPKRSVAGGLLIAFVVAVVLIGAAGVGFAVYRARIAPRDLASGLPSAGPSVSAVPSSVVASAIVSAPVTSPPSASVAPDPNPPPTSTTATGVATGARQNPKGFNAKAAKTALDVPGSILAACKDRNNKTGPGVAHVTFANDGTVALVIIDKAPYAGTSEADCISSKLKRAKMASFEGPAGTVDYAFTIAR